MAVLLFLYLTLACSASVEGISKTGFLPPTKLPSENENNSKKVTKKITKSSKKTVMKKKNKVILMEEDELDIKVLDDG